MNLGHIASDHEHVRVRTQLNGFLGAADRFSEALADNDADRMFYAIFEALNWSVAIDDRIQSHWAPEGRVIGREWRSRVQGAEILKAIRWARNSVHHDWADALRLEAGGFQFPMTFPLRFSEWVWKAADLLPDDGGRFGKSEYEHELSGRPARIAISELRDVFSRVTMFLDPPSPSRLDGDHHG